MPSRQRDIFIYQSGLYVLTIFILTIVSTGLFAACLWRANRKNSRRGAAPAGSPSNTDLEAMRRSRDALLQAQRIGRMGSWECDPASDRWEWSDEAARILEIAPAHAGTGRAVFLGRVHPDDRKAVEQAYAGLLESGTSCCIEYRLLLADGNTRHVRQSCEAYQEANGQLLRGTLQDITELKQAESRLGEVLEKLRVLFIDCESEQERERSRIAWEMHEEIGQLLAVVKMRIYGIHTRLSSNTPLQADDCGVVIGLIDQSIERVHRIVCELRPTVLLHGIEVALEWLADDCGKRYGINCELETCTTGKTPDDELVTLAFRIAQQALDEIAMHGGTDKVQLAWADGADGYLLTLRFCGERGMLAQSLGLFGMQQRVAAYGGRLQVDSAADGTVIAVRLPDVLLQS